MNASKKYKLMGNICWKVAGASGKSMDFEVHTPAPTLTGDIGPQVNRMLGSGSCKQSPRCTARTQLGGLLRTRHSRYHYDRKIRGVKTDLLMDPRR